MTQMRLFLAALCCCSWLTAQEEEGSLREEQVLAQRASYPQEGQDYPTNGDLPFGQTPILYPEDIFPGPPLAQYPMEGSDFSPLPPDELRREEGIAPVRQGDFTPEELEISPGSGRLVDVSRQGPLPPPRAPPQKKKSPILKPPPFSKFWMRAGMIVFGVGGGALAGYVSGHNRENFTGNVTINRVGLCLDQSDQVMTVEFILPTFTSLNGQEAVLVEVIAPDQTCYLRGQLNPSEAFPSRVFAIPAFGAKTATAGEYLVTFRLIGGSVLAPAFLGGLRVSGIDLLTNQFPTGSVLEGTQVSLTFHYPGGPFAFND